MAAVCPACGVAVVPGYVRCPKCHTTLPSYARNRRGGPTIDPGGTAMAPEARRVPVGAIVMAVIAAAVVIAVFALRHSEASRPAAPPPSDTPPTATPPAADDTPDPAATPPAVPDLSGSTTTPTAPSADATASRLERGLRRQHLWSTVEVVGGRVDVRSSSCRDPAMRPALDGARAAFKAAGLTRVRCLEESGGVVFDRDL